MQTVLLDANALLLPFQFRVNLQAELRRILGDVEILIPTPVLDELRGLSKSVVEARAAIRLAEKFPTIEEPGSADDALVGAATRMKAIVVTSDAALLRRLREIGVPRVSLRSRSHLVLEGL